MGIFLVLLFSYMVVNTYLLIKNFRVVMSKKKDVVKSKAFSFGIAGGKNLENGYWIDDLFVFHRYKKAYINSVIFSFISLFVITILLSGTLSVIAHYGLTESSNSIIFFLFFSTLVMAVFIYLLLYKSNIELEQSKLDNEINTIHFYEMHFGKENGKLIYELVTNLDLVDTKLKWIPTDYGNLYKVKHEIIQKVLLGICYTNEEYKETILTLLDIEMEIISENLTILKDINVLYSEINTNDIDTVNFLLHAYTPVANYLMEGMRKIALDIEEEVIQDIPKEKKKLLINIKNQVDKLKKDDE